MKASETQLTKFLDGTKQFIIPIYQRTYRWEQTHCQQLWDDIIRAANDENIHGHFIGSIVYIQKGLFQITSPSQLLVIDGHQRLTTLSLLLMAMSRKLKETGPQGDISYEKILNYYLINSIEAGELKYKLILTKNDKQTYINLVDQIAVHEPVSRRILDNYRFFEDQIIKSKVPMDVLFRGISKLILVDVALDRTQDNPQRIFESMNSTGLDLAQSDLIRNYILMGRELAEQEKLYNNYWFPMEQSFGQEFSNNKYSDLFNRFMRDYLTLKTRDIPAFAKIYEEFKRFTSFIPAVSYEQLIADICTYANYYVTISREQENDKGLREIFKDINELKVEVAFPFLLEVYDDYTKGLVKIDEFKEILSLTESYVFRRAICGISPAALNQIFATIGKEVDKQKYLESFKAQLLLKEKYRRYPDDKEFKEQLMKKDLYYYPRRNYCLGKLENFQHKESINVLEYTVEHIMPQDEKLSPEWKTELGEKWQEIHKNYLHTLGNLTLTGYNSEYGKRSFREKRDMSKGFKESHLLLNSDLATLEHWNELEIKKRAQRLAELATIVWPYPQLAPEILQKYQKAETSSYLKIYTLADHPHVFDGGKNKDLFLELRKRILNLDASVIEEILKIYIAYKTDTNFVDVVPLKSRLNLTLNVKFGEIQDPKGLCKDVTGKGKWGNGDVEIWLTSADQLDDVMALIKQSFEKHSDMNI
jgi:uncharacterized protein with ParB-like and HNH nuclease domain/predicted transport protein